jgi:capsular exopolysaccharide synthesis family protein
LEPMSVEEELKTYLQVLWHYKWIIAASAIIASLVALVISLLLTPRYTATATIRVASAPGGATDYTYIASSTPLINTYVEIAKSDTSLNEVEKRLGLQKKPSVQVDVVPETELITIKASDPNPAQARDIANKLADLMVEQSMQLYGGNVPTASEILAGQLQQAKNDLDSAVAEYDTALRGSQPTPTPSASSTPLPNLDVETLANLVSVRQQIYGDLLQKYEAARTSEQSSANAITITEPAYLPLKPTSPKIPLNAALGLLAGLAMGVILAFLFEGMDGTLRGIEDVQAITTLPILCKVPELKRWWFSKAILGFSRNGHLQPPPAFDQLRTRLILFAAKPKSATFLITSPEPGAGKSTIAANLAVSLAQGGNRVVLVDMDFRRPRQHSIFNIISGEGLSNFMRGEIQLEVILQTTTHPDLRVITAGSSPEGLFEWLTPDNIRSLLETLGLVFDYVLIDAPALLSVAEPMILASQADAVILVVARRKTERMNLRITLQQLTEINANVVGIVVNKVLNSQLYSYYTRRDIGSSSNSGKEKPQTV